MRTLVFALCLLIAPAFGADDYNRIIRLEQDIRDLERHVSTLQREVSELRRHLGTPSLAHASRPSAPASSSAQWVDAKKWHALQLGASEMEAIEILGPPTSMRRDGEVRILLYAMEIGSSGFLSGSVTLENRKVTAIEFPVLK